MRVDRDDVLWREGNPDLPLPSFVARRMWLDCCSARQWRMARIGPDHPHALVKRLILFRGRNLGAKLHDVSLYKAAMLPFIWNQECLGHLWWLATPLRRWQPSISNTGNWTSSDADSSSLVSFDSLSSLLRSLVWGLAVADLRLAADKSLVIKLLCID